MALVRTWLEFALSVQRVLELLAAGDPKLLVDVAAVRGHVLMVTNTARDLTVGHPVGGQLRNPSFARGPRFDASPQLGNSARHECANIKAPISPNFSERTEA